MSKFQQYEYVVDSQSFQGKSDANHMHENLGARGYIIWAEDKIATKLGAGAANLGENDDISFRNIDELNDDDDES